MKGLFGVVLFICVLFSMPTYGGITGNTVAIVQTHADSGTGARIKAELESQGFSVIIVVRSTGESSQTLLEQVARDTDAGAAILCLTAAGIVDVQIVDRVTGKTVRRQMTIPDEEKEADALVALRAVELLRASFLEVETTHERLGDVEATQELSTFVNGGELVEDSTSEASDDRIKPLNLELGTSVLWGSLAAPPMVNMTIGFHMGINRYLGVALLGMIPLRSSRLEEVEGDATIRMGIVGAGLRLRHSTPGGRWLFMGTGGWAVGIFRVTGLPAENYEGNDETLVAALPYIRGGVGVGFTRWLYMKLDAFVGWTMPKVVVQMDSRTAASYGNPVIGVGLTLDFTVR